MALGTRELYLVLRARDEASRVLRGLQGNIDKLGKKQAEVAQRNLRHGQAMASMGIAVGAAGAVGVNALNNMADAAVEYNKQAAKTLTQTDGLKVSVQQLADIGRDVAKQIPAPFEEMQDTLYDIFSSMDVNVSGAHKLLKQFAKDSVGGATDIQTAGRSVIQILNAWSIPVTKVSRVSDVMFQLVRKGVGTYQEFAKTIGRAVPSAVRAGQSVETLAGGLAFLTRQGLSTAMASTSMARALDALSNPKAVKNLKELGVQVVDSKGKFRPLVDIIADMNEKTKDMSAPQKSKWLTNAFKGAGGTIQAMRFFNLALGENAELLPKMIDNMNNAKGAAKDAYKVMANTPAARIQELNNRWQILRTEVGDRLIPVKLRLVNVLIKLLKAWDKLSPSMKTIIVQGAAVASVLAIILGAVLAVAGVLLMFKAGLALAGIGLGGLVGPIGIVIGVLALLGAAIYMIVKHWDTLKPAVMKAWDAVKTFAQGLFSNIVPALKQLGAAILPVLQTIGTGILNVLRVVGGALTAAGKYMTPGIMEVWNAMKGFGEFAVATAKKLWAMAGPILIAVFKNLKESGSTAWNALKTAVMSFWTAVAPSFGDIITTLKQLWTIVVQVAKGIITVLKPVAAFVAVVFVAGITAALVVLAAAFKFIATFIQQALPPVLSAIGSILGGVWNIIKNFVGLVAAIFKGDWAQAWEYAKKLVVSAFGLIVRILKGAADIIFGVVHGLVYGIIDFFKSLYNTLVGHSIIPDLVRAIISWFRKLPGALLAIAKDIWNKIKSTFSSAASTVLSALKTWISLIGTAFGKVPATFRTIAANIWADVKKKFDEGIADVKKKLSDFITNIKGKFDGAKKWLVGAGSNIISGLKSGITGAISGIGSWVKDHIVDPIINAVKKHFGIHSPSTVMAGLGGHLVGGMIKGIVNNGLSGAQWVGKIFGGFGKALGNFIEKGRVSFSKLPERLWGTVKGLGGKFAAMVKKAQAAKAALSSGGNGGYDGPVSGGAAGIKRIARSFHPSYIAGHRDPQGGPAFDIGSSGSKNNNIANALRANHGKLGLRYVISQMRIASARSGWKWRQYHPITNKGDFRHTGHVHVSYARGGWINELVHGVGMRTGRHYTLGEKGPEKVTPKDEVGGGGPNIPIVIYTQEINPTKHAADLGWLIAQRVG